MNPLVIGQDVVESYLDHALRLSAHEYRRLRAITSRLPDDIIDAHVHTNSADVVSPLMPRTVAQIFSTFPSFDLSQSLHIRPALYPDKRVRSLRFPGVLREVDHRKANEYLFTQLPSGDAVAAYGLVNDLQYTEYVLRLPGVSALKMYPHDVDPPAAKIYQYFRREILEIAQTVGKPIILHLPTALQESVDDVLAVAADFPRVPIVLAHMGLTHVHGPGYRAALGLLRQCENVFLDAARVLTREVYEDALDVLGSTRVIFGSDEPLNLLRTVAYNHPTLGVRVATDFPYHWRIADEAAEYGHLANGAVLAHIAELEAIVGAIDSTANDVDLAMSRVFFRNASELFNIS